MHLFQMEQWLLEPLQIYGVGEAEELSELVADGEGHAGVLIHVGKQTLASDPHAAHSLWKHGS